MDKEARARLRKAITLARKMVEGDIKAQLKRLGVEEGGKKLPVEKLPHLSLEDKELRDRILKAIEKEKAAGVKRGEAYERYVRHVGFTYINRLAALRAMEVRKLIRETVIRADEYAGMSKREYELSEREGITDPVEISRRSSIEAFKEVSREIRVLFDVDDEYSLLFPSPKALKDLIRIISVGMRKDDWLEDDIVGWIYQYYNSEVRTRLRKKTGRPRPDDIPVINQFYTPRWIVRTLVDNTLGRLWLEMKGRSPKPGQSPIPDEISFQNPSGDTVEEYCSYLVPINQERPPREEKNVRKIKILDPACGSGHFLIYAFDVLYRMYREDEPETPPEEIPNLILENNLFGIDIDLRAVQLAALSLYLKAKQYNPNARIRKMNLVCADARITDGEIQRQFLLRLEPDKDLQRVFAKVFKDLKYTYEVGSLLKVRKPFERLLGERRKKVQTLLQPQLVGKTRMSEEGTLEGQTRIPVKEIEEIVAFEPMATLEEMLVALLEFEREGMEKRDMGTMLFAAEAEKSVGLLTVLTQEYDVVVMNPPYGDMPKGAKEYSRKHYPKTHHDYYAAFIEQAVDLCRPNGFVGMLTGRTFMFLKWFERIRTEILYDEARPEIVLDLNATPADSIIDEATGRWSATIARKSPMNLGDMECLFVRLTPYQGEEVKIQIFKEALIAARNGDDHETLYPTCLETLEKLPRMPYSYWLPPKFAEFFQKYPPLDRDNADRPEEPKIADVKPGLQTSDDARFVRYWWEINPKKIASNRDETCQNKKWLPYVKGGDRFYSDIKLVVDWEQNGKAIKDFPRSLVSNEKFYFHRGLCYSDIVSSILMDYRILPEGTIFSNSVQAVFPADTTYRNQIMAFGNSSLAAFIFLSLDPSMHHRRAGYISQLPVADNLLCNESLGKLVQEAHDLNKEWDTGNEVSTQFIKPWILQALHGLNSADTPVTGHPLAEDFEWSDWPSCRAIRGIKGSRNMPISELGELCVKREKTLRKRLYVIQGLIDDEVYRIYGISDEYIKTIDEELSAFQGLPKKVKESKEEAVRPRISAREHVLRLISYYVKLALERDQDGIVTLDELVESVRRSMAMDFGEKNAERADKEIESILGSGLREWLAEDYFKFHIHLYGEAHRARRPIFWHLTSRNFARKRGPIGAFNCFLHHHKLDRDTIPKILEKRGYLRGVLDGAKWRVERTRGQLRMARESEEEEGKRRLTEDLEEALDILEELQGFAEKLKEVYSPREEPMKLDDRASWVKCKIAEVRDNGFNPVLDYGVRVNIEPLKEANLLHRAAERVR